jgi:hypothetical protein
MRKIRFSFLSVYTVKDRKPYLLPFGLRNPFFTETSSLRSTLMTLTATALTRHALAGSVLAHLLKYEDFISKASHLSDI